VSKVAVVGAGYVGLSTAAGMASLGHDVTCADVDAEKVRKLSKGEVPIREEGLPELVSDALSARRLRFVKGAATAAADAEFVFLCVPTPQGADGAADLSIVDDVAREIAPMLRPGTVVVNKSTMPVGSTTRVARTLAESGAHNEVAVASNPEFLREGTAVRDFLQPTRVVIGSDDPAVAVRVSDLYKGIHAPILVTDPASAEMIKYAANAFLATKVSFVNAIANICEAVNADIREVALGMGYDPRIGFEFLHPGPGWGGSCFPKDSAALMRIAADAGYEFSLLQGAIDVNDEQHRQVIAKIHAARGGSLDGARIAVWGLTFKANTDDLRDSPSVRIAGQLAALGATVRAFDPAAGDHARSALPAIEIASDPYEACAGAEVLAVLTEWDEFRWLDFDRVGRKLAARRVVDARNLLDPSAMRRFGFEYTGIGR
jgi:UDPglucose 6-dehydrogenase